MDKIIDKALALKPLTNWEALMLFQKLPLSELLLLGDKIRYIFHPKNEVSWQIDRNVNITNVCVGSCKFCNFHCRLSEREKSYITTIDSYKEKIDYMLTLCGDQLLLQGGMHPKLKIDFYENLFSELKSLYPKVRLHALGAPEVFHIAKISSISVEECLERLVSSGLDSLPGAGAEILDDKIRKTVSPGKCSATEWLEVMRAAHKINLPTSATMMYGHIEEDIHIIEHLIKLRDLQNERPEGSYGFLAFIPWVCCTYGTKLAKEFDIKSPTSEKYLRIIAISRIVLNNINNIQASWLTMGRNLATLALHSGANDLGSIMIEENVVASAGITNKMDENMMKKTIISAGFTPFLRNQLYERREGVNYKL
ncbi:MAG: CofH family radical SAM protein [Rikenellaceae bacterium]